MQSPDVHPSIINDGGISKLVQQRNSSELSCESTDSDGTLDGSEDNWMDEPLLKMVKCTTYNIWDDDTGEPIRTEYDLVEEMNG